MKKEEGAGSREQGGGEGEGEGEGEENDYYYSFVLLTAIAFFNNFHRLSHCEVEVAGILFLVLLQNDVLLEDQRSAY